MKLPKILVTGAGGKTGFATALQLCELGYPVRAFVHREGDHAAHLKRAGAEIFVGNLLDVRDLRKALTGVQRAYYCVPFAPNALHGCMAFAVAADEARLECVSLISQWLPHPAHPSLQTREHWLMEQILPWMPSVDVTIVNPGLFADVYFLVLEPVAQLGIMPLPFGQGRNAPPSNEDIARVVVKTLVDPVPHLGKTYRPTGPELITPADVAGILSKVLQRPVKYQDVPIKLFNKAAKAMGFPLYQISQVGYYAREHQHDTFAVGAPTDVVRELTGRQPEDFEAIARRYVATRPQAILSLSNKLSALRFFMRLLLTPAPDVGRYEREQNHALIDEPVLACDSAEWRAVHGTMAVKNRARDNAETALGTMLAKGLE